MSEHKLSTPAIKSAQTVLLVLKAFGNLPEEVSLAEVVEVTRLPKMKAFRALTTLTNTNFLVQNEISRKYRLHHSLLDLSSKILNQQGLRELVHDRLQQLANDIGEDITFAVPSADFKEIVFIDRLRGGARISFFCDVGKHIPLHVGSAGKAIMAHLTDEKFESYLSNFQPVKISPFTIIDKETLRRQRREILQRGYSVSDQEVDEGVSAVGVCVLDAEGNPIGAAAIASLTMKMTNLRMAQLGSRLKEAVSKISAEMGFKKENHVSFQR